MVNINNVYAGSTLKADDLQGRECTVVIAGYDLKEFDGDVKPIIRFQGHEKGLVCNKTNANRIATHYGPEMDNWIGRKITLYPEYVDFQGRQVLAIRVRGKGLVTQPPSQGLPVQNASHPNAPLDNNLPDPGASIPADADWDATAGDDIPF